MFNSKFKRNSVTICGLTGLVIEAQAAVPAGVTAAIEAAQADMVTVAGAIFIALVALVAFKLMRKALA